MATVESTATVGPARHRGLFWTAVLVALAVVAAGVVMAVRAYLPRSGPGGAVRGYFAALARSDAPAALGYGELPPGPHTLLTSTVLRLQQKIAPIGRVHVVSTKRSGDTATVEVQYTLGFAGGTRQASDTVHLVRRGQSWRLARSAVATRLTLAQAGDRASIAGAGSPDGPVLLFPGALPISFDDPYLRLAPGSDTVAFSSPDQLRLSVAITPTGRTDIVAAVTTALRGCLAGGTAVAASRCPLPSDRYVPGSLHASLADAAAGQLTLAVSDDPAGVITVSADAVTVTGSYTMLDFNNRPVAKHGSVKLPIRATVPATTPLTVTWGSSR